MQFKDYYKVMGVAPEASADEIKNAYRKLARKFHPDVSKEPQADKRFKEVGEAYEALKDPEKRAAYDKLRAGGWREGQEMEAPPQAQEFRSGAGGAGGGFSGGGFAGGEGADFSDFFQSLFGGPPPGSGRRGGFGRSAFHERGEDIHHAIAVTLEESYHGGERQLQMQVPQVDEHGAMSATVRTITAKIPKGVIHGSKIRLRGQGHPGATANDNGNLYLEVELAPHRLYRADGRDLTLEVPIAPWEAVLGAQAQVPTLGGTVTATIPAGAQDGQKLRLKGRGLPGEPPGDQYLVLRIAVPPQASDKAKALYRDLAKESAFNPRAKLGV